MRPDTDRDVEQLHQHNDRAIASEPPDRILRLKAVLDRTGLSRSTLYRKIDEGTFPSQIRIAARCVGWRESAINTWLNRPDT